MEGGLCALAVWEYAYGAAALKVSKNGSSTANLGKAVSINTLGLHRMRRTYR